MYQVPSTKKITIAIDGYSSTGKSTIAKQLAKKLDYTYIDTGAMYRAVALYALEKDFIENDHLIKDKLLENLDDINLEFVYNTKLGLSEIYLNGRNIEAQIRNLQVSRWVSDIAAMPQVRNKLVDMQRAMGKDKGVVMDGRDIGSVVLPDAELKLFITTSPENRAKRRFNELIEKGSDVNFDEVLENINYRDHLDATRKTSPLIKVDDAIEFDNTHMGLNEQFEKIYALALEVINF